MDSFGIYKKGVIGNTKILIGLVAIVVVFIFQNRLLIFERLIFSFFILVVRRVDIEDVTDFYLGIAVIINT